MHYAGEDVKEIRQATRSLCSPAHHVVLRARSGRSGLINRAGLAGYSSPTKIIQNKLLTNLADVWYSVFADGDQPQNESAGEKQ